MPFHHRRLLADQRNESATADWPGRLWLHGMAAFVVALSAFAAFLIIDRIIRCLVGPGPQPGRNATANPENSRAVTVGAGQDPHCSCQLQAIPVLIYVDLPSRSTTSPEEEEICPVCLGEYAAGEEVRVLPRCGHMFHKDCIDRWLAIRSSSCPTCRATAIKQLGMPTEDF